MSSPPPSIEELVRVAAAAADAGDSVTADRAVRLAYALGVVDSTVQQVRDFVARNASLAARAPTGSRQ